MWAFFSSFYMVHILLFLLQCVSILFAFVEHIFSWKLEWLPDLNIQICFVKCEAKGRYSDTGTCYMCIFTATYMSPTKMVTVKQTHSMFLHAEKDMKRMKQNAPLYTFEAIFTTKLSWTSYCWVTLENWKQQKLDFKMKTSEILYC